MLLILPNEVLSMLLILLNVLSLCLYVCLFCSVSPQWVYFCLILMCLCLLVFPSLIPLSVFILLVFDYLIVHPHIHILFPFFFSDSLPSFILITSISYTSFLSLTFPSFHIIFTSFENFYSKY